MRLRAFAALCVSLSLIRLTHTQQRRIRRSSRKSPRDVTHTMVRTRDGGQRPDNADDNDSQCKRALPMCAQIRARKYFA